MVEFVLLSCILGKGLNSSSGPAASTFELEITNVGAGTAGIEVYVRICHLPIVLLDAIWLYVINPRASVVVAGGDAPSVRISGHGNKATLRETCEDEENMESEEMYCFH